MNDYDPDETPAALYLRLQRERQAARNYVPAAAPAPLAKREQTVDVIPQWLATAQPVDLSTAWAASDGARENTSAMDRAQALRVRLVPFVGLWALLGVIVGIVVLYVAQNAPGAALGGLLTFSALTAYTYYRLNRTDYDYSREGTERHKIDTAAYLVERQLDNEHELRRMALEAYLETLDRNEGRR